MIKAILTLGAVGAVRIKLSSLDDSRPDYLDLDSDESIYAY